MPHLPEIQVKTLQNQEAIGLHAPINQSLWLYQKMMLSLLTR